MSSGYVCVSDGACRNNPGPGGWGLIVLSPDGQVREFGGAEPSTTNNRMELFSFYRGLQEVYRLARGHSGGAPSLRMVSDSKYVLEGASKNLGLWTANGWKTVSGDEVKNRDLWEKIAQGLKLLREESGFRITFELVKGHAGSEANERVDQIAVKYSKDEVVELYTGPRAGYPISLETGAVFEPVYLSLVQGKLMRHRTWDECRTRVEGKAGARYKKVKNRLEERETLESWGVSG